VEAYPRRDITSAVVSRAPAIILSLLSPSRLEAHRETCLGMPMAALML